MRFLRLWVLLHIRCGEGLDGLFMKITQPDEMTCCINADSGEKASIGAFNGEQLWVVLTARRFQSP